MYSTSKSENETSSPMLLQQPVTF